MKDKIIIQFKDKKYIINEVDEEEYYRIVGIVASRDYEYTIETITDHFVDRSKLNKEEFNWDRALRIKVVIL